MTAEHTASGSEKKENLFLTVRLEPLQASSCMQIFGEPCSLPSFAKKVANGLCSKKYMYIYQGVYLTAIAK